MGIFPNTQGQVTHDHDVTPWSDPTEFRTHPNIMGFLVACKHEEHPIKNEGARVVTTLFINFSDAQGELTPKSVKESCPNSNSSKLL